MSKKTLLVIPPEFREPLGPPPVLNTEDAKRYWALFGQLLSLSDRVTSLNGCGCAI
jgi:hypothetical protein